MIIFAPLISFLMLSAVFPSNTTIFGLMRASCRRRYGLHAIISSGFGALFAGGKCFTVLVMKTSSLCSPISSMSFVRYFPALPTNGWPVLSSCAPGAWPMKNTFALEGPSPGTPCCACLYSGHLVHSFTSCATILSESFTNRISQVPVLNFI